MRGRIPRIEAPIGLWTTVRIVQLVSIAVVLDLAASFMIHQMEGQGWVGGWAVHFLDGFLSALLISAVFILFVLPAERQIWRRRETELRDSQAHQGELLESMNNVLLLTPSGVALISQDGTVLRCNAAFEALIPGSQGSSEGRKLSELLPLQGLAPFLAEALEGKDILHDGSFECPDPSGVRFLRVSCLPMTPLFLEGTALLVRIIDETQSRQAAEAIKQNEARLSAIVEEQTELVARFTPDHRLTFANHAFRVFYGLAEGPLPSGPFERPVDEMDREWVEAKRRQLGPRCPNISYWHRAPGVDGTSRSLDWTESALFDEEERLVEYQAVGRDETPHYEAIERLKESERQVNFILNSAPVLIWMADARGKCTFFNKGWLDFTGRTLEEELGDGWTVSVHPEDRPGMLEDFLDAVADRNPFRLEYRVRRRDGVFRWVLDRGIPLISEAGDLTGYIGCCIDTTLLKEAEAMSRSNELRYRQLLASLTDAFFVHEAGSEKTPGRFLEVNDIACQRLAYTREELLGMTPFDIDAPDPERKLEPLLEDLFSGRTQTFEQVHRAKDGRLIPVEISARVIQMEGKRVVLSLARDITKRKKFEAALREAAEINHLIVENVRDGVFVFDSDLQIVLWNPMMEKLSGLKASDVVGHKALDPFPFLVETGLYRFLENAVSAGNLLESEQPFYIPASGEMGWVSSTYVPLHDVKGETKGVLVTVHDTTQEHQAREALEASSNLYRGMFETNNAIKLLIDPSDGRIVDANPGALDFYGYGREQFLSMSIFDINQLPRAEVAEEMNRAAQSKRGYFVFPHKLASGERRHVEVWSGPVEIQGRRILFSIVHDISDRIRAEQELRHSEARFRAIFDHAGLGIALATTDRRIVKANQTLEEILGYARGSLEGLRVADFTEPEDSPAEELLLAELRDGKRDSFCIEKRHFRKDGSSLWADVTVTFLRDDDRKSQFAIAFIQDITIRRRAIEELQRSKESLRALSSRLLSIQEEERKALARELHDGLGQSLTALSYGLRWVAKHLREEQKDVAERVSSLTHDIGSAIGEVRRVSRHLRPASLDLGLGEALESEAAAFERRTEIRTLCTAEAIPALDTPRATALFRIAQEALTNIARHSGAKEARISLRSIEGQVVLEVSDDGKGFAPEGLSSPDALGILGARERVSVFGGTLYLSQNRPHGTRLIVQMPAPRMEAKCSGS